VIGIGARYTQDWSDFNFPRDGALRMRNNHTEGPGGIFLASLDQHRFYNISFGVLRVGEVSIFSLWKDAIVFVKCCCCCCCHVFCPYLHLCLCNFCIVVLYHGAKPSSVTFEVGGGNPHWCSGVDFDSFSLYPVGVPWRVLRLLVLGATIPQSESHPSCPLFRLPKCLLREIVSFLP
jgi:hypothetical protein